jgi:hypothetical protein
MERQSAMLRITAALLLFLTLPASAVDTDSGWQVTTSETGVRYAVTNGESRFAVTCTSLRFGGGVVIDVVIKGIDPAPWTETKVLLNDEEFHISHGPAAIGMTDCRQCSEEFKALWSSLRKPTAEAMRVAMGERLAPFTVRGGDAILGDCITDYDGLPE